MGGVIGLDYASAKVVLELDGMWTSEIVRGLRIIAKEFVKSMGTEQSGRVGKGQML